MRLNSLPGSLPKCDHDEALGIYQKSRGKKIKSGMTKATFEFPGQNLPELKQEGMDGDAEERTRDRDPSQEIKLVSK